MEGFSAKDICQIIKQAGSSGVKTLKLAGFEIEFEFDTDMPQGELSLANAPGLIPTTPKIDGFTEEQTEVDEQVAKELEVQHKQDELSLLLIENPAEYERLQLTGDLDA